MRNGVILGAATAIGLSLVGCVVSGDGGGASASHAGGGRSAGADISVDALRANLELLAADELGGRSAGTPGYEAAAEFVEVELANHGVDPLFASSADALSYRQPFGLANWRVARGGSMTIDSREPDELALLQDMQVAYIGDTAAWGKDLPVVFVGSGVVEQDLGVDELAGLDLDGACAALFFDLPAQMLASGPPGLRARNPQGNQGLERRVANVAERGAVCVIALPGLQPPVFWREFLTAPNQLQGQSRTPDPAQPFVGFAVGISDRGAATLFAGQIGDPNLDPTLDPFALTDTTVRFDLELRDGGILETANIGGVIPGTDSDLEDEVIVLSAHLDGQGTQANGVVLNSANDNAASVVALLEAARHLARAPGRRPVMVLFTSAEELGLFGSEHFVDNPPVPFSSLALNVNMEMVGKRRRSFGGYQFRVSGRHSDEIETLVTATRDRHGDVDFDYERRFETPDYQFRRADHVRFFLRGVPTIYFYGGGEDYHQPSDDANRIEYEKVRTMAEVLVDLIRVTDTMASLPKSDGRS
ncbi:MAG: M20/M25/M40 family metallo-hydrolase [Acidobacteria bacterium]|nr:M20/M25/M40 family metallo-hydrolase [Acidobacteriota bacterium]